MRQTVLLVGGKDISKPNVKRLKLIADDMNITVTELLNGSDKT